MSVMHKQKLSSLLSDGHEMADYGLDAHAINAGMKVSYGAEEPDKLVCPDKMSSSSRADCIPHLKGMFFLL